MANVTYNGRADERILSADDLKKAGVEGFTKRSFVRGQAVEVEDSVAKALIDHPNLFGKFSAVEAGPDPIDLEAAPKSAAAKGNK